MVIRSGDVSRASRQLGGPGTGLAIVALALGLGLGVLFSTRSSVRGSEAAQPADVGRTSVLGRLDSLEAFAPPVGTVMAYAGPWPPRRPGVPTATESSIGWLLCDGRSFAELIEKHGVTAEQLTELRDALGGEADRLPDYGGLFLRGVGGDSKRNPDSKRRFDARDPNKEVGDRVGSVQKDATRRPDAGFVTDNPGNHQHLAPTEGPEHPGQFEVAWNARHIPYDYGDAAPTSPAGGHTHTVLGGDQETRPHNAAVYWIIKFRTK